ncbi:radical SAM family heme chaperone HemW [Alteromonas sp. a30]|uniref:radical SAM family heme chaperone HemW n=1 Tax=Alteromonas sp. a30 TaxID=2730917 RepID=UPI0022829942|nr:radical SAM family heme chaperone HemW [Alteromonas sp. a30]MCY7296014.1 radical SAM family heme chaperone HemW [Alteromonas sp. a30]
MQSPPLSLYIHIPWCVQKCPYCDFNSHGLKQDIPEDEYISHLLADLEEEAKLVGDREVKSLFFGGGTPSLFSAAGIQRILQGVRQRVNVSQQAEITLEANPGTVEAGKFLGFKQAGVNRISVGVQSFQAHHLLILGRIHDPHQAIEAIKQANQIGLNSFNIDLMHGLPKQNAHLALDDLQQAIALNAPHISWYQLTIEPNTLFHSKPPLLPEDEMLWDIQEAGQALLQEAGYQQYEISGYSKPEHRCQHNLNYWRFGDYIGIGCGAHGKITQASHGSIQRRVKVKHPKGYMDTKKAYLDQAWLVEADDLPFEFFMNQFRLFEACPKERLAAHTGLNSTTPVIQQGLQKAIDAGWLAETHTHWETTELGKRFLNELLTLFLDC